MKFLFYISNLKIQYCPSKFSVTRQALKVTVLRNDTVTLHFCKDNTTKLCCNVCCIPPGKLKKTNAYDTAIPL